MTLTIYLVDGNKYQFEGREAEEVFRKIEDKDIQFIEFRREKYLCMINREYIVSIVIWED